MRHTLLPLHERIILRKAYRVRAVIVLLSLLTSSLLIGIAALFPSFMKAYSEESAATRVVASTVKENDSNDVDAMMKDINSSKKLLTSLQGETSKIRYSIFINGIIGMRENLRLTSIAITKSSTTTISMIIQGIAPTRNSLLSFKSRFESAALGNKVDLPVSQLGKSANIQFSLKLTQKIL